MKNIDKIRQMDSEELAEFISKKCDYCKGYCLNRETCIKNIKQWLESAE